MAIEIKNNAMSGGKTFVRAPADAPITAEGNKLDNVETAFDVREPSGVLQKLGLPADTPIADVIGLLKAVRETPDNAEKIAREGLAKYLPAAANWAQIGSFLLQIAQTWKF
jgi:hypothetical protein